MLASILASDPNGLLRLSSSSLDRNLASSSLSSYSISELVEKMHPPPSSCCEDTVDPETVEEVEEEIEQSEEGENSVSQEQDENFSLLSVILKIKEPAKKLIPEKGVKQVLMNALFKFGMKAGSKIIYKGIAVISIKGSEMIKTQLFNL
eukprot:TRINITY_DN2496_c0_g1_i1.p1 TRINITY_DN2496_c0_g1~~TRINITY_DN2496_c0_g1_i1.p1  ORF type:complete len:149 (-),score=60.62 TRINITY_DN2496_c0_g1_i1:14-460(-)